jgi:hypothetical protein
VTNLYTPRQPQGCLPAIVVLFVFAALLLSASGLVGLVLQVLASFLEGG